MSKSEVSFLKSKLVGLLAIGVAVAGCSSDGVPSALNIPSSSGESSSAAVVPETTSMILDPALAIVLTTQLAAGDTFQASVPGSLEPGETGLSVTFLGEPGAQDDITVPATSGLPIVEAIVPIGVCSGPISVDTNIDSVPGNLEITALSPLPAPVITNIDPNPALPGQMITLTGEFFAIIDVTVPVMGGGRVTPPDLDVAQNQITFTLPANAIAGGIEVTNSGCDDGAPDTAVIPFELLGAPTIEDVQTFILPNGATELEIFGANYWVPGSFDLLTQAPIEAVNVRSITFDRIGTANDVTIDFVEGGLGSGADFEFELGGAGDPGPQKIVIPVANIPAGAFAGGRFRGRIVLNGETGSVSTDRRVLVLN